MIAFKSIKINILLIGLLSCINLAIQIDPSLYNQIKLAKQSHEIKERPANISFNSKINQFVFQKTIKLNDTFSQITGLHSIDQKKIQLKGKTEDGQQKLKIFTGSQYQIKQIQLKIPSQNQQVKFIKDKIFINSQGLIEQKSAKQSIQFIYNHDSLTQAMLVTEKYVLLNELISCDKLIRIWFENMKVEVIEFKSPNCSNNWNNWFMRDLNNGKIVFGGGQSFFILDKDTLQIKQKIQSYKTQYENMKFTNVDSFYQQETNTSIIQLSTTLSNTNVEWKQLVFKFSHQTQKYQLLTQIYNTHSQFKLTRINQALSFYQGKAYHWNKLNFIKALSFDQLSHFYLKNRNYVLVSNSQEFFVVLFNQTNNYFLELYQMDQSFQPKFMFNFNTTLNHITQVSSDDKILFTLSENSFQEKTLRIFDISSQQKVQIHPKQTQQFLNFNIFNTDTQRFILLISKINQSLVSEPKLSYWIQIRNISKPNSIIKQIQLIDFPLIQGELLDFKIVSNPNWGLKFVLYCLQNSVAVLYSIENDILIKKTETQKNLFTSGIYASSQYLIHIDGNDSSIKIYSNDELQLIERIDAQLRGWNVNKSDSYILKDDKLFVRNFAFDSSQATIYDFSRQRSEWYVGSLQPLYTTCNTIFFPKRNFAYFYTYFTVNQPRSPVKAVFDISFPIDKKFTLVGQELANYVSEYLYLQKGKQRQCDLVAMLDKRINNNDLIIWKNCQPFTEYKIYNDFNEKKIILKSIFYSSDKKHLIQLFTTRQKGYFIQIRNIDDDFKIIYSLTIQETQPINNVDLTRDNLLIILSYDNVKIFSINDKTESISFSLKNIHSFESIKQRFD